MRKPSSFLVALLATTFLFLMFVPTTSDAYQCSYNSNSSVVYYPGYGDTCSGFGSGCTYCWDGATGDSCVEAGFNNCFLEENRH